MNGWVVVGGARFSWGGGRWACGAGYMVVSDCGGEGLRGLELGWLGVEW